MFLILLNLLVKAQNQLQIRGLVAVICTDYLPNGSGVSYFTSISQMKHLPTELYVQRSFLYEYSGE
jgi:hypothetical protein